MDDFTKYFEGGLTQRLTSLNLVQTHVEFGTTSMGDEWAHNLHNLLNNK
jgi:hypothetical protein